MKVWEVTFEFDQRVQAQLAMAANTEDDAKAGVIALLAEKNPELQIIKVRDMTDEIDKSEDAKVLN